MLRKGGRKEDRILRKEGRKKGRKEDRILRKGIKKRRKE